MKADIGFIGLAVMGQNLVLNMADHDITVAVFNRTISKVDAFKNGVAQDYDNVIATHSIEELVSKLIRPRRVMLMVKAGEVVDQFIAMLLPHLEAGDIIIDGGNSYYGDTTRRQKELHERGILFSGTGISGGEIGARRGPSMMPGGAPESWPHLKDIFQAISAKTPEGESCCNWVGEFGSGHFVKMVHNGIEYGDMQIICEAYDLMKRGLKLGNSEIADIFTRWNKGHLKSYLIEITADILRFQEDGEYLVDKILDVSGQKGTGKWTGIASLEYGQPVTLITEAVFARCLSSLYEERQEASAKLALDLQIDFNGQTKEQIIDQLEQGLYASKIISYAQGFMLIKTVSDENQWNINLADTALLWREGCIIKSIFLGDINTAYKQNPQLTNLILSDHFAQEIKKNQAGWRTVISQAVQWGIPMPAFTAALSFFDGYRSEQLPANLLQAQRDYFGAHTYEKINGQRGEMFHTNWTGQGGDVASSKYEV